MNKTMMQAAVLAVSVVLAGVAGAGNEPVAGSNAAPAVKTTQAPTTTASKEKADTVVKEKDGKGAQTVNQVKPDPTAKDAKAGTPAPMETKNNEAKK
ncbi:MAG: hypothetical protein H7838_10200 [Magnetococcus sp. DMHC-8]